jgi:hypothetical protein
MATTAQLTGLVAIGVLLLAASINSAQWNALGLKFRPLTKWTRICTGVLGLVVVAFSGFFLWVNLRQPVGNQTNLSGQPITKQIYLFRVAPVRVAQIAQRQLRDLSTPVELQND